MNSFAASHSGLAPVVVIPDGTGSEFANPMCLDSNLGHADTYLARDVPGWIRDNLQIDSNSSNWAIGGFSYGGTCALQFAVRYPQMYSTFLDISGQQEPTLGDHTATVRAAYGGDDGKFQAVNPLTTLTRQLFTGTTGFLTVGRDDQEYGPQADRVAAAARHAGMKIDLIKLGGGHSWAVAADALRVTLPDISARLHLTLDPALTLRVDPPQRFVTRGVR
jgi:S-formylglutathione hydrolase FrmB